MPDAFEAHFTDYREMVSQRPPQQTELEALAAEERRARSRAASPPRVRRPHGERRGKKWARNYSLRRAEETSSNTRWATPSGVFELSWRWGQLVAHLQRRLRQVKLRSAAQHRELKKVKKENEGLRQQLSDCRKIAGMKHGVIIIKGSDDGQ